ncbi:chemotaxis protein CheC [Hominiventricola aquisgranensis]|uniref:Chemotaxis protein CheC n=1 Tax=Hominiventricola aquisgranensis TaxID=3133164 RepID=A0ABV1I2D5_9FIRM|nr:chemotaxis protein CheC [Clostridiaceae bacterium Marseille-Q4143]
MAIYRYEELGENQMDVFREIGSIGNGNAITALSGILSEKISMELPEVNILEFNMAQKKIGDAEEIVGAVLVEMSGELSGLMMLILKRDFIKTMIKKVFSYEKENLLDMEEMEESLLIEVGNIMLSSYISALSSLTNIQIHLSVPQFAVNMLGGILSMPMAMMGIESDQIMMITGAFSIGGEEMDSNILLLPDIRSLNVLMKKLGVE